MRSAAAGPTSRAFRNCLRDRGLPGGGGVEITAPR
jgi:hypothetical protein